MGKVGTLLSGLMRGGKKKASSKPPSVSEESLPKDKPSSDPAPTPVDDSGLPRYDPNSRCKACRSAYASSRYEFSWQETGPDTVTRLCRMERICDRCGYKWYEGVLG